MDFIAQFIFFVIQVLTWAIFIRAILSWFPVSRDNTMVMLLMQVTDPILLPIRRVVPTIANIDITPLVAIFLLQFLGEFLIRIL